MKMSRIEKLIVNSPGRQRRQVRLADELLAKVPLASARRLLEVGCGVGTVSTHVAENYALDATGVDLDAEQIATANERAAGLDNLRFLEGDATGLPFEDAQFDVVLSFMAMHHVADCGAAFREIARVLKPGGVFIYADIILARPVALMSELVGHSYRLPSMEALNRALEASCFVAMGPPQRTGFFVERYRCVYRLGAGRDEQAVARQPEAVAI